MDETGQGRPGRGGRNPMAFVGLGFELIAPIVVLGYVGFRLDGWFGTAPWLLVALAGLGMAVGFLGLFRRVGVIGGKKGKGS